MTVRNNPRSTGTLPGTGSQPALPRHAVSEKHQAAKDAARTALNTEEWQSFLGDLWSQTNLRTTACDIQCGVPRPVTRDQFAELQSLTGLAGNITFRGISIVETEDSPPGFSTVLQPEPGRRPAGWIDDCQSNLKAAIEKGWKRLVLRVPAQLGDRQQLTMLLVNFVHTASTCELVIQLPSSSSERLAHWQMETISRAMKACNAKGIRIECHHDEQLIRVNSTGVELPKSLGLTPLDTDEWQSFLGDLWNQTNLRTTECDIALGAPRAVTPAQFGELQVLADLAGNITFRGIRVVENEDSRPTSSDDLEPAPGRWTAGWIDDYQSSLNGATKNGMKELVLSVPEQLGDRQQLTMLLVNFVHTASTGNLVIQLHGSSSKGLTPLQMGQIAWALKTCDAKGISIECHHGQQLTRLSSIGVELPSGVTLVPGEKMPSARDIINS
jgi:hypothetical protein